MPKHNKQSILKQSLIFCEGLDEYNFLIAWLNSKTLADVPGFANDIQVVDFGGISDLYPALASYKSMDNFNTVHHLMIIRDAERDSSAAVQSIQSALHRNGFTFPDSPAQWVHDTRNNLHLGFMLFPSCSAETVNGTLEDLCLQILAGKDAPEYMTRVDAFIDDLETWRGAFSHKFKTRLHTYFSVSGKFTALKIGEAAKANAFDWSRRELDTLRDFVRQMIH